MARKSIFVLVLLVLSVAGMWAQTRQDPTAPTTASQVLSGENIGVRMTGAPDRSGRVQETLVVRINGQWVDVVSPSGLAPAK